jgi:hypothetical protein
MAAVANNPKFAKKSGVPQSVGEDFVAADKGKKFRSGSLTSKKAGINKPRTNHGKSQMPNYSLKYAGKKEGGVLIDNQKEKDMKKMNPGLKAMLGKKIANEKDEMKRVRSEEMVDKAKMMGMKKGGMACSPSAMKKTAKTEVKGHEKRMHGMDVKKMAKGGGCEVRGKTKGTMIKMKKGGSC